jgi:hypothetical protein
LSLQLEAGVPQDVLMTGIIRNATDIALLAAGDLCGQVRGHELYLMERMAPVVRKQSDAFDLGRVERIDTAGMMPLISL